MALGELQRRTKIGTGHDPKARCFLFNKTGGYFRRSSLSSPCSLIQRSAAQAGSEHSILYMHGLLPQGSGRPRRILVSSLPL